MREKNEQFDVELSPSVNADSFDEIKKNISPEILSLYEVYSYRHAAAILKNSFSNELNEIEKALFNFKITIDDIAIPGGSESTIPKKLSSELRPNARSYIRWGDNKMKAAEDLLGKVKNKKFSTILADPPWQFTNRTGKMAPEHKRLNRYPTMTLDEIKKLPVGSLVKNTAHLYLWVPNALIAEGLQVMTAWGFTYKTNLIWYKIRKDGGPDRRGVGFYFRNVTEMILFGVKGKNARTLQAGRSQENIISSCKREHSRKPDEQYELIENCSQGPFIELFARGPRKGWFVWGNQSEDYSPRWETYANNSQSENKSPIYIG